MSTCYVGEIRLFGFPRIPNGWFACDGSLKPISQYEVLYTLLGTTYGGDGVTTFGLPDLRGQLPMHQGQGPGLTPRVIGEASGSEQVTLLPAQMPTHGHLLMATSSPANATVPGSTVQPGALADDTMYVTDMTGATPLLPAAASVSPSGGTQPHDNLMPTQAVSFCIAWAGIFPSQN